MADDKLFYSISEAANMVGVEEYVLRFWEKNFPAVKPARKAGRRYFRKRDIDTLLRIKDLLYRQGFTIKGAKKALSDKKARNFELEENDDIPIMDTSAHVFEEPPPPAPPAPPKRQRVLARFSTGTNNGNNDVPQAARPASSAQIPLDSIVKKIEEIEDMLK